MPGKLTAGELLGGGGGGGIYMHSTPRSRDSSYDFAPTPTPVPYPEQHEDRPDAGVPSQAPPHTVPPIKLVLGMQPAAGGGFLMPTPGKPTMQPTPPRDGPFVSIFRDILLKESGIVPEVTGGSAGGGIYMQNPRGGSK